MADIAKPDSTAALCPSRRSVVVGTVGAGAAAALGGCAVYGEPSGSGSAAPPVADPATSSTPAGDTALARVSDIPVGGGKILAERKVVLTHPQQGTIQGFATGCTHAGCAVTTVSEGTINCACHGSRFRIADGAVSNGPASRPLPQVAVAVDGDVIRLA